MRIEDIDFEQLLKEYPNGIQNNTAMTVHLAKLCGITCDVSSPIDKKDKERINEIKKILDDLIM